MGGNLFENIVRNISDGVYVVQDDHAIFLNERFARIFGHSSAEALIQKEMYREVYPDPETVGLFREIHQRMLAEKTAEVSWAQLSARTDGTPFWLEVEARWIEVDGRPAILGIFHDQTDCKLIAEAMHVSQETLRLVLDAMEDRVYVVTDDYRIVYANRKMTESMCGDPKTEPCYRVCRGLDKECADCCKDMVFTANEPVHREMLNERLGKWFSVIELAIRVPGLNRPAKLAVARDITARKKSEQRIRALSHRLLSAQEDERRHLSRELHDDLGQRLNAAKLGLDTLTEDLADLDLTLHHRATHIVEILRESIQEVRQISAGLRPSALEKLGLIETLHKDCEKINMVHGLKIDFHSAGLKNAQFDSDTEINLYRVFQESLQNVIKHACATEVSVRLIASHPFLRLKIQDDGQGFNAQERLDTLGEGNHLGLLGMAERIDFLNGTFSVNSHPGCGTRVVIEIPYCCESEEDVA